jgi:hypothetical protein
MYFQANKRQALRLVCTEVYCHSRKAACTFWRSVQHASTLLRLISKALRVNYDKVADEPVPERWVELIHHLNHRERVKTEYIAGLGSFSRVFGTAPMRHLLYERAARLTAI